MTFDVAVIGAGPAGLASSLALCRARKRVVLFDAWPPRNAAATEVRGYVTQDGTAPAEIRRIALDQLAAYEGFQLREEARVVAIRRDGARFAVEAGPHSVLARRVLLAVGLIDDLPDLPGYRELWGTSLFQCPYCHAWEVRDGTFGYLAPDNGCADWATLLRAWTKDLVIFTSAAFAIEPELRDELAHAKIRVEERQVVALRADRGRLAAVRVGARHLCGGRPDDSRARRAGGGRGGFARRTRARCGAHPRAGARRCAVTPPCSVSRRSPSHQVRLPEAALSFIVLVPSWVSCCGMCVARALAMKLVTKLVITGSLIAIAAALLGKERSRRNRLRQRGGDFATADPGDMDLGLAIDLGDPGDQVVEEVTVIATSSGMADVDPEPLAQTAGEGIALDPVTAAHTEIEELRERLPRPGKGT